MRLTKVASNHSCWIYETVWFAAILSARGSHNKSVLVIQLVKVKYFFSILCGLERNQPFHFGLLYFWIEPFRLFS